MTKSLDTQEKFIKLRAAGETYNAISRKLNIAVSTLWRWNSRFSAEIEKLRAPQLEQLYEEFHLLKEQRIRLLGGPVMRLAEKLKSRDLTQVPTRQLIELFIRAFSTLRAEIEPQRVAVELQSGMDRWEAIIRECVQVVQPDDESGQQEH